MSRGDVWGLSLVGAVLVSALAWMALVRSPGGVAAPEERSSHERSQPTLVPEAVPVEVSSGATQGVQATPAAGIGARWSELNSLAIEALEAGRFEEAIELFEECLAAEPSEPVFATNLAEALARRARAIHAETAQLELPISLMERAVELAPARADLAELLARWRKLAAAEAEFWTDETAHFTLSYDGDRGQILNHGHDVLTSGLEAAYAEFALAFNHDPVPAGAPKIRVVLYSREDFSELTGVGHWAGGVYDGVVRVPVVDFARERSTLSRVMRHELVHAFLRSMAGQSVPAWLNEGLAQWFELESPSERAAAVSRARATLAGTELFALEQLKGTLATWKDTDEIARGYAQSLALVAFIEHWYGERVLVELVEGCGAGETCEGTFERRIGVALSGVLSDLEADL